MCASLAVIEHEAPQCRGLRATSFLYLPGSWHRPYRRGWRGGAGRPQVYRGGRRLGPARPPRAEAAGAVKPRRRGPYREAQVPSAGVAGPTAPPRNEGIPPPRRRAATGRLQRLERCIHNASLRPALPHPASLGVIARPARPGRRRSAIAARLSCPERPAGSSPGSPGSQCRGGRGPTGAFVEAGPAGRRKEGRRDKF